MHQEYSQSNKKSLQLQLTLNCSSCLKFAAVAAY